MRFKSELLPDHHGVPFFYLSVGILLFKEREEIILACTQKSIEEKTNKTDLFHHSNHFPLRQVFQEKLEMWNEQRYFNIILSRKSIVYK